MPYSTFMTETTPINETEQKRLAGLIADRLNDWLFDDCIDLIHEACNDIVVENYPDLNEDELWEMIPEVFDRLVPFTSI
jgi:hypothetical protein